MYLVHYQLIGCQTLIRDQNGTVRWHRVYMEGPPHWCQASLEKHLYKNSVTASNAPH